MAADSVFGGIISSGVLFCAPKTRYPQIRIRFRPDLSS